ncbi:MAG TPA: ABC transporter substrate-binding protein [Stellaceae bacterium]|nr:ABC transporter substrate-binding protein [Stellaceae bacterium]
MRLIRGLALSLIAALALTPRAHALDKVHAGTAVALWAFLPLQIGQEEGIWKKYGIDLDITNNGSDAKLQQAMTAGSIDFGLGSGAAMAFAAKGAPVHAVAAFAGEPKTVTIIVAADSPVKGPGDLKGKLVVMPGVGSVSEWLVWQMSIQEGWGKDGIHTAGQGSIDANVASIETHQADAMTGPPEVGYLLDSQGKGHVAFSLAQFAPHFHAHVIFARNDIIQNNPELVRRFLKGFFAGIAFMKTHKEATTAIAVRVLHNTPEIMNRIYDDLAPWLESDGHFDPQAIEVMKSSFVDMGILDKKPSNNDILTTRFVPVTP